MIKPKLNPTAKMANGAIFDEQGKPKPGIQRAVERAIDIQRPLVVANLRRLHRKNPQAAPAELSEILERDYLRAVTAGGAAVGATAIVPVIGTIASLGLSAAATVGFLEATALYAQSIAELHGVHTDDPDRARTMVMAILLGDEGKALIQSSLGASTANGASKHWGNVVGSTASGSMVKTIGASIRKRFLRRLIARQGGVLFGRALPFGAGAVVGGAGNRIMGRNVVKATREAFGPVPDMIPGELFNNLSNQADLSINGKSDTTTDEASQGSKSKAE